MTWKKIAAAAAMVSSITPALADDQTVTLVAGNGSFIGSAPLLLGGDDIISFLGLAPGLYQFDFSMSSQFANITSVMVNGQAAAQVSLGMFQIARSSKESSAR